MDRGYEMGRPHEALQDSSRGDKVEGGCIADRVLSCGSKVVANILPK